MSRYPKITAEFIMLVVLVATLIIVPVIISASQVDDPHRQFHLKHPAGEKP
jgi:hypothetical protein